MSYKIIPQCCPKGSFRIAIKKINFIDVLYIAGKFIV